MGKSKAIYPRPQKFCEVCKTYFNKPINVGKSYWARRRFCSKPCQYQYMVGKRNEQGRGWKGENVTLNTIHSWLYKNYGKANKCENENCLGKSKFYDWAKKTECQYEKKRENFMMLCRKCHHKYDGRERNLLLGRLGNNYRKRVINL